ncbi:elongation factor P [Coraliomargarita parva]|uniref:elongation factor P n=1 Tax=Coraliomargarita parva TaxID=3014050 RepID=UPI0022B4D330|nr:elongation factor P [Coraliomargarita parva]
MASPTDVRKGKVLNYQGNPHLVLDVQHRTQGRQAGFMQVTMRNLNTGSSTTTKIRTTDSVEIMHTDNKKLEFSYVDGDGYHFMDPESFEDIILDESLVEDAKDFLVETTPYSVLHVDDKPISIDLPASIEMKVIESPEGVKGDTASNVQKPAKLETGLTIQVPLFIKEGEIIKVSTSEKAYMGRA